jgi:ABC-type glutathione transport system ATPase component
MPWIPGLKNNAGKKIQAPILSVRNLSAGYGPGGPEVLRGVNFDLAPGETLVFTGKSEAGKTTLALILAGYTAGLPGVWVSGEIRFCGAPFMKNGTYACSGLDNIAIILQDPRSCFVPHEPVGDQIAELLRRKRRLSALNAVEAAGEILEKAGVPGPRITALPVQLSGGQTQMAAAAFALARRGKLIVVDEGFNALDAESRFRLLDLLIEDQKKNSAGMVLFSRDGDFAVPYGFKIYTLKAGHGGDQ